MTYPGADPATEPDRAAVETRRQEREAEFSEWIAAQDIPWGAVPANFRGEAVAKSTVEARGWDRMGLVVKRSSKQGRQILEELNLASPAEQEAWATADKAAADKASARQADKTSPTTEKGEK